jgi:hypothetical protein
MTSQPHTTHHACDEVIERDGGKAVGCCCSGHERLLLGVMVQDLQLNMRLQFDARKHDFATFDAMLAYMNGYVSARMSRLATKTKGESNNE